MKPLRNTTSLFTERVLEPPNCSSSLFSRTTYIFYETKPSRYGGKEPCTRNEKYLTERRTVGKGVTKETVEIMNRLGQIRNGGGLL